MTRIALKPGDFPWYDYSRYTFSLGLKVGDRTLLSGHSASEYDATSKNMVVKGGMAEQTRTAYAKIAAILEAGGQSLADVVRVVEYVTTAGIEHYAEAAQVRGETFGLNRPALNTVVVKSLLRHLTIGTVFRGVLAFNVALIALLAIVVAFPQLATFLPRFMK